MATTSGRALEMIVVASSKSCFEIRLCMTSLSAQLFVTPLRDPSRESSAVARKVRRQACTA
jgi:hypothetical protein